MLWNVARSIKELSLKPDNQSEENNFIVWKAQLVKKKEKTL